MTENEAIKKLEPYLDGIDSDLTFMELFYKDVDRSEYLADRDAFTTAITALKEIQQYREIGTVEECRKAVEKQKAKKCVIDSCPDHTHYKCPSCGKIYLSRYNHGCPNLGRIPIFCEYCGQAIDENLEGMEDESSAI